MQAALRGSGEVEVATPLGGGNLLRVIGVERNIPLEINYTGYEVSSSDAMVEEPNQSETFSHTRIPNCNPYP